MEIQLQSSDGSITRLKPNSNTVFGRANGFHSTDLSVSRRHLSFDFNPQTSPRVSFEVLGKNPVWVFNKQNQNHKIEVYKRFERGELGIEDMFCVSPKSPIWFTLKKVNERFEERESKIKGINERVSNELSQSLESVSGFDGNEDLGLNSVHLSDIDPVQEFGFLVIGHEFDHYPKQMIRDVSQWNWFLEDSRQGDSDDDEDTEMKVSAGGRKKRKKRRGGDDDVDDDWTESEGEEVSTNLRKLPRPNTRSKEHGLRLKGTTNRNSSTKTSSSREKEEESEDEDDETLGGFVVHDDAIEEEDDDETDEDEEEEFVEDEDELEE